MNEISKELQVVYEALKAGKTAKHLTKIDWYDRTNLLSVRNTWGDEYNDIIVHISIDKEHPGKFTYHVIGNKELRDTEKYLTLETKEDVTQEVLMEVVHRFLSPEA